MASEEIDSGMSQDPALLSGLTEEQKARLTEQLDRYLCSLEQGEPIDCRQITAAHPDLAEVFNQYLAKLDTLYSLTAGIRPHEEGKDSSPGRDVMQLGDFTILREIGRGGMGVVYEANQRSLGRRVAIKLLPLASLLNSHQIARFYNEARAAGLLQHSHIVPVYSIGMEQGIHFYAMQLIDGMSLEQWIHQRRDVQSECEHCQDRDSPADTACHWRTPVLWLSQIADALHSAHEAGVVHRDVKPSNLMLDGNGKVWITDFGLARCQTEMTLTHSGDLVGTMRYMSPEQARGESVMVDGRSDIYSLAATLYEMLTLNPAHPGSDAATILKHIGEHAVIPIRRFNSLIPRDLETVLRKAMALSRDGRYETAAAFAEDLRRVLAGEPTHARPPTVPDKIGRWASKHRRSVLASLLVCVTGLVGFALSTAMIAAEKRKSDVNARRSERSAMLAREAVDRLGSQMAELLADIPNAEEVRRRLLAETLDYYQQFAANAQHGSDLGEDLAVTYGKIGSLHSQLEANQSAISALRRSEELYAQLADAGRLTTALRLDWSISQNNLAQVLHRVGQVEEATAYYRKAIEQQESLVSLRYADAGFQLAITLNNLGLLLADASLRVEAEAVYLRAISLLTASESTPMLQQRQLDTVRTNLSGLLTKYAPQRAAEYARTALADQTANLQTAPGNIKLVMRTVVTLNTLAAAQAELNQFESAANTLRQAIAMNTQLLELNPHQATSRRDMVLSLNQLGLVLVHLGELTTARDTYERAIKQQLLLAESFPTDAETHSMLGGVLNNLGFLHHKLGESASATECYEHAVRAQEQAIELAPHVTRYREYLRKHMANLESFHQSGEAT